MELNQLMEKLFEEILADRRRRFSALGEKRLRTSARELTALVAQGLDSFSPPPVQVARSTRQLPPGISEARRDRFAAILSESNRRLQAFEVKTNAILLANQEARFRQLFQGTGASSETMNSLVAYAKKRAGC